MLLLGIDIGTSGCKVTLFEKNGAVVAAKSGSYPVYYPHPGWAEQNPDDWWYAVCDTTKKLIEENNIDPCDIAGIGIDGQSWSAVAIDREGKVLANTPIWMDTRAKDICDRINGRLGEDKIFEVCGNILRPSYTTAKILWYQEMMPDVYRNIYKILQSNSFIVYRLTGAITQDISQTYGFHCIDMRRGEWDDEMCQLLGIPKSFLPDIFHCHQIVGKVTEEAAKRTGLTEGIPVVAGGLDAACGALGAGVLDEGDTQEQGGQAGGMSICLKKYAADTRLILSYHVVPERWLLQGGTTGGGGVMRWLEKELGDYERSIASMEGKSSMKLLDELAEAINPGSDGLIFLPYMAGERSPIWNPDAKGVFYGLDFSKTKGHIIRSGMEGVAFSLQHNLDVAKNAGAEVKELLSVGGAANSRLWMQIKSDITGIPMKVPYSDTATTLGAAILAGVGVGVYKNFEKAVKTTVKFTKKYEPDMEKHKIYQKSYCEYLNLYKKLS